MIFRFVTLPLKRCIYIKENTNVDFKSMPSGERRKLLEKRSTCLSRLEAMQTVFEKGSKSMNSSWQTSEGRESLVSGAVDAVNSYVTEVSAALYKYPVFAYGFYYQWSSSLAEKQEFAYDDFRYDLQCMYFNLAAVHMNMAELLLCWHIPPGQEAALKKESYHYLLQAAGYFSLVKEMAEDVNSYAVGSVRLAPSEDFTGALLDFCQFIALGQAQEIGTARALESEESNGKGLAAKLIHQLLKLCEEARNAGESKIASTTNAYTAVLALVQLKVDLFRALAFGHTASHLFDTDPSAGLWFVSQSEVLLKIVGNHLDRARKSKKKIPFRGEDLIQACNVDVQRCCDRCRRINSLVHRVKPATGPLDLPPPAVLAQKREVKLPALFPHQVQQGPKVLDSEAPTVSH